VSAKRNLRERGGVRKISGKCNLRERERVLGEKMVGCRKVL